jgi:uncharacterized protein (DUF1684 family)
MLKPYLPVSHLWIVTVVLAGALACSEAPAPVDPAYTAEVESWRDQRLQRLTADDGWLTLTGLFWLEPGENSLGSAADNSIVLPDPEVAGRTGFVGLFDDGQIVLSVAEGSGIAVNGQPLTADKHTVGLAADTDGRPDIVTAGRASFSIIERDGRLAVRVKDPEAPTRKEFRGLEYFPINPELRVEARFEPYEAPREVAIPTVLEHDTTMLAFGRLHFSVGDVELTLEPYMDGPDDDSMFLIFRDATSGDTTYGAGRFLSADAPGDDGVAVLDFNFAYNPPCAFTPYATCPLPPPQNVLPVAIEAGEMYAGVQHH